MRTQIILREKFREVQQAKCRQTGTSAARATSDSVNIEELVTKGLRRINVLIEKPVDLKTSAELEKRMKDINVSVWPQAGFHPKFLPNWAVMTLKNAEYFYYNRTHY